MRFDTQSAGRFLVECLQDSDVVSRVLDDGSDIVLLELVSGHQVMLYLIDSSITSSEIRQTLQTNTQNDVYTLYFFWCDLMLPPEKQYYEMDDWMKLLVRLYGDKMYGFEVVSRRAYFFPVYFQGKGNRRFINFGTIINYETLGCLDIPIGQTHWKIAGFSGSEQDRTRKRAFLHPTIAPYFQIMGLPYSADLQAVKLAYRRLARLYHPDLNPEQNTTDKMQQLNDAYEQLIHFLKED